MRIMLSVNGMHCRSCEKLIESDVSGIGGVSGVKASYVDETAEVEIDPSKTSIAAVIKVIGGLGYPAKEIKTVEKTAVTDKTQTGFLGRIFGGKR